MRQTTRNEHERSLECAVEYVLAHLDEDLDIRQVADRANYSRFHFHRVFNALLGETAGDMIRRLRLERAAHDLRTTEKPITELAFEAGYATHEAFIRAFRVAFGCSPSKFRKESNYDGSLPTPNGVHYRYRSTDSIRFAAFGGTCMDIDIREAEARRAVCKSHSGPYYMIGKTFGEFYQWAQQAHAPIQNGVGIYYQDPDVTPPDELRSHAGAIVPVDYVPDGGVDVVDLPAGTYAVATHVGPYDGLSKAWSELWAPTSRSTASSSRVRPASRCIWMTVHRSTRQKSALNCGFRSKSTDESLRSVKGVALHS